MKKTKWKKVNIYKPGTKRYYRDALENINDFCVDYNGYRTVKGLKSLIDDIKKHAIDALNHKTLYLTSKNK